MKTTGIADSKVGQIAIFVYELGDLPFQQKVFLPGGKSGTVF